MTYTVEAVGLAERFEDAAVVAEKIPSAKITTSAIDMIFFFISIVSFPVLVILLVGKSSKRTKQRGSSQAMGRFV